MLTQKTRFLSILILGVVILFGNLFVMAKDTTGIKVKVNMTSLPEALSRFNGAVTCIGPVATSGNITIDGRCYDINGNLMTTQEKTAAGVSDTYGISTANSTVPSVGGSSQVGGTEVAPNETPIGGVTVETNATLSGILPHEILGFASDAALRATATVHTSNPNTPLSGINYVTTNSWIAPNFGTAGNPSTGVLIMHNASGTALLKNIHGVFKGIIIADDITHINGDANIIGALFCLTTSGNVLGNGAAGVKYSPEAISQAGGSYGAGATTVSVRKGTWKKYK